MRNDFLWGAARTELKLLIIGSVATETAACTELTAVTSTTRFERWF